MSFNILSSIIFQSGDRPSSTTKKWSLMGSKQNRSEPSRPAHLGCVGDRRSSRIVSINTSIDRDIYQAVSICLAGSLDNQKWPHGGFLNHRTPSYHPFSIGIFPNKNHPAVGYPPPFFWGPPWNVVEACGSIICRDAETVPMGKEPDKNNLVTSLGIRQASYQWFLCVSKGFHMIVYISSSSRLCKIKHIP